MELLDEMPVERRRELNATVGGMPEATTTEREHGEQQRGRCVSSMR
jgi:hypothetical protein